MKENASRCQIIRKGNVIGIGEDKATIKVGGKKLPVPLEKVERNVAVGDEVLWTGKQWEKTESNGN